MVVTIKFGLYHKNISAIVYYPASQKAINLWFALLQRLSGLQFYNNENNHLSWGSTIAVLTRGGSAHCFSINKSVEWPQD